MSSVKAVTLFLCLATSLFGQTIKVSDDSPGSPVALRGTVSFGESYNLACFVTGYNKSSKGIITSAVELKVTKPSGKPEQVQFEMDHFFKELTISLPKADFAIASGSSCEPNVYEVGIDRTPAPPEAHAKLLFVQYEDGSVWGDAKVGVEILKERAAELELLQSLKNAYSTGGPEGLAVALAKDQTPGTMAWSKLGGLRMIRDASGLSAVADTIDKNLAMAEVRKAALLK